MPLRIVFFGTAELARVSLAALLRDARFDVAGVVCQPDRAKGRDLRVQPCPVKIEAFRQSRLVLQPERARDPAFVADLKPLRPELIVVAAYGQILPQAILEIPRLGCINVHASLLPKYRGAAPIQWSILDDQAETGVTIMKMDAGLDTGDILSQQSVSILETDDAQTLHDRLAEVGADLLIHTIPEYASGRLTPRPQPKSGASYARKITKEDGRIDWTLAARTLWNRVRAFTPWPGAFTLLPNELKQPLVKIRETQVTPDNRGEPGDILVADKSGLVIRCGEGALRILKLQREGGRLLTFEQFLAGHPLRTGSSFLGKASPSSPKPEDAGS